MRAVRLRRPRHAHVVEARVVDAQQHLLGRLALDAPWRLSDVDAEFVEDVDLEVGRLLVPVQLEGGELPGLPASVNLRQSLILFFLASILSLMGTLICPSVASRRVGPAAVSPPPPASPPLALSFSSLTAPVRRVLLTLGVVGGALGRVGAALGARQRRAAANRRTATHSPKATIACLTRRLPSRRLNTFRDAKTYRLVEPLVKRAGSRYDAGTRTSVRLDHGRRQEAEDAVSR